MYKLKLVCFDSSIIKEVDLYLKGIKASFFALPKKSKKITILKSPHVNKKSKEHFSLTQYRRLCYIEKKKSLREIILRLPFGIAFRIDYSGNGAAW